MAFSFTIRKIGSVPFGVAELFCLPIKHPGEIVEYTTEPGLNERSMRVANNYLFYGVKKKTLKWLILMSVAKVPP